MYKTYMAFYAYNDPGNILMNEQPLVDWKAYPTPRIGDFGLALFDSKDDAFNPDAYTGPGARGYRAPEQTELLDPGSLELVQNGRKIPPVVKDERLGCRETRS